MLGLTYEPLTDDVYKTRYSKAIKGFFELKDEITRLKEENEKLKNKILELSPEELDEELDRYWDKLPKSDRYEIFVGHYFEKKNYQVEYYSLKNKKEGKRGDWGID